MKSRIYCLMLIMPAIAFFASCGTKSTKDTENRQNQRTAAIGEFNCDSAYAFVDRQVAFGPRVPGSEGHKICGDYLISKLASYNPDTIMVQEATVTAFNGDRLPVRNILARFNSLALNKILLVAHWDTRPWADNDPKVENRQTPVPGANDGGSGVGVLLEIARNLAIKAPECGVDILLTDAEDYGGGKGFADYDDSWCLGTQYFVKHSPYSTVDRPSFGILLDMVGGHNARFHREFFSNRDARPVTAKVWAEAQALGYEDTFINKEGTSVIDDHVFLNRAGIPTTDIIESMNVTTGSFPATWHTVDDNMQHISRHTLDKVGKTVLNIVYKEKDQ